MKKLNAALLGLSISLTGCFEVGADVNVNDQRIRIPVDLDGPCQGTGTSDDGSATWTKDDSSGKCHLKIRWSGDLVDLADAKKEIPKKMDSLKINRMEVTVRDLVLLDDTGTDVTPRDIEVFQTNIDVEGNLFYTIDQPQLAAAQSPAGLTVTLDEGDPILTRASQALEAGATLPASADIDIITTSVMPVSGTGHELVLTHDFLLEASGRFKP